MALGKAKVVKVTSRRNAFKGPSSIVFRPQDDWNLLLCERRISDLTTLESQARFLGYVYIAPFFEVVLMFLVKR